MTGILKKTVRAGILCSVFAGQIAVCIGGWRENGHETEKAGMYKAGLIRHNANSDYVKPIEERAC